MKRTVIANLALPFLLSLAACGGGEAEPEAAPDTVTPPSSTATIPTDDDIDITAEVKEAVSSYGNLITSADMQSDGQLIKVGTSIVDPRGEDGSPEAKQAVDICQRVRNQYPDVPSVRVHEQDGTTFAVYMTSQDMDRCEEY